MPVVGLEPTRVMSPTDFESVTSANSITPAQCGYYSLERKALSRAISCAPLAVRGLIFAFLYGTVPAPSGRQFETILSLNKTRDENRTCILLGAPCDGALFFVWGGDENGYESPVSAAPGGRWNIGSYMGTL